METFKGVEACFVISLENNPNVIDLIKQFYNQNNLVMRKKIDYVVVSELPTNQQKDFNEWMISKARPTVESEGKNKYDTAWMGDYVAWRARIYGESVEQAKKHLQKEPQEKIVVNTPPKAAKKNNALPLRKSHLTLTYMFGRIPKQSYRHFPIIWFGYSKNGVTMNILGFSITVKLW